MGHDGMGVNKYFGYDAFGFTLGYYLGDYEPIDASTYWTDPATRFEASLENTNNLRTARFDLFNGNIGHMVTALYAPVGSTGGGTTGANMVQGMAYRYDQLNRLMYAEGYDNLNVTSNEWQQDPLYAFNYGNAFTYDANGNILTQRKEDGEAGGDQFENLTYQYHLDGEGMPVKNRLYHVNETIAANTKPDDIDDQGDFYGDAPGDDADLINGNNNYIYDEIGQLITDESEGIQTITWRVDAKIKYVSRDQSLYPTRKELGFDYDAMGNRIAKHVYDATGAWEKTTYYVRDASGNVMSTYEHTIENSQSHLFQTELHIYGSSRLGMLQPNEEMIGAPVRSDIGHLEMIRGIKVYELSNHLGNVLGVVTDQKLIIENTSPGTVHHYLAEVISYTDYYPFGSPMAERTWEGDYRYGFNGKEREELHASDGTIENSSAYDFGARIYDGRLGRFLSVDAFFKKTPSQTKYSFASNCPISAIDMNGDSTYVVVYGSGWYRPEHQGGANDVGDGFKKSAEAKALEIKSRAGYDESRDEVILVYCPTEKAFLETVNKTYPSGKIAELVSYTHGTVMDLNFGGEKTDKDTQEDKRWLSSFDQSDDSDAPGSNGKYQNEILNIDKSNFEANARVTLFGCNIGGRPDKDPKYNWTRKMSFAQKFANHLKVRVKAFFGGGGAEFKQKTDASGKKKNVYDGEMIRSADRKSQQCNLEKYDPEKKP